MFDRISFWWQTDPKAKQKLLFGFGALILIILTIFLILMVGSRNQAEVSKNPQDDLPEFLKNPEATKVDISKLNSNKIRQVLPTPLLSYPVLLDEKNNNTPIFLNSDFRLQIGQEVAPQSPKIVAVEMYKIGDNIILNENGLSLLYNLKDKKFKAFGADATHITPFENKFLFINKVRDNYFVKVADDLELRNTKVVATISPNIATRAVELKIFKGNPYFLAYDNFSRLDTLEIWNLSGGKVEKVQTLQKIRSISFGKDKIMYTSSLDNPTLLTNYSNQLVDFSANSKGIITDLPIAQKIIKDNVFGTVAAQRCTIQENSENIYCFVKQKKVSLNDSSEKDVVLIFNYKNNEAFYPYMDEAFSGSKFYLSSDSTKKFFVAQENKFLYEIL